MSVFHRDVYISYACMMRLHHTFTRLRTLLASMPVSFPHTAKCVRVKFRSIALAKLANPESDILLYPMYNLQDNHK